MPVRLGFLFSANLFPMTCHRSRTRLRLCDAAFALILMCGLASAAATQATGDSTAAKQPATKNSSSTHKKTTRKKSASSTGKISTSASSTHPASAHSGTAGKPRVAAGKNSRKKTARVRGQQKIDSDRAEQIQEALIREHYLTGEPTGTWNTASEEAMRRYQADHGWQTKEIPDSRALIRLGLGPSNDHLLNPESAMTTVPVAPKATSVVTASHSTSPTADSPAPASTAPATSASPAASVPPARSEQNGAVNPQ